MVERGGVKSPGNLILPTNETKDEEEKEVKRYAHIGCEQMYTRK